MFLDLLMLMAETRHNLNCSDQMINLLEKKTLKLKPLYREEESNALKQSISWEGIG